MMIPQALRKTRLWLAVGVILALQSASPTAAKTADPPQAETPIEHLVVIYLENASFFNFFGTYPVALNPDTPPGPTPVPPAFHARPGTPSVNGLTNSLLNFNPNQVNPFRIARLQSYTCDQNHKYEDELEARNQGLMNMYVEFGAQPPKEDTQFCQQADIGGVPTFVTDMGYFDGNTVTALWNYAQHFALSDNFFATMSGESTRSAITLIQADTYGALCMVEGKPDKVWVDGGLMLPDCGGPADSVEIMAPTSPEGTLGTILDDTHPFWDICSQANDTVAMSGRHIGDLLNAQGITWGWFQGGFKLPEQTVAGCTVNQHPKIAYDEAIGVDPNQDPVLLVDYVARWNPFQFYQSSANPMHDRPSSTAMIGRSDQARHLYDLEDFWDAAAIGNVPAVSFLKPPQYQAGHPGESEPLDQQVFVVETLNRLQQLPEWDAMAVFIAWDDSDGWYDHVMPPIINRSTTSFDTGTSGQPLCGNEQDGPGARCAYGPRIPFLVVSPFAKENYVSHVLNDITSMTRFIEDNWLGGERIADGLGADGFPESFDAKAGSLMDFFDFAAVTKGNGKAKGLKKQRRLFLDPKTGLVLKQPPG